MPKAFVGCVRRGGKVRTVKGGKSGLKHGEYRHICVKDGKAYIGEVKKKKN